MALRAVRLTGSAQAGTFSAWLMRMAGRFARRVKAWAARAAVGEVRVLGQDGAWWPIGRRCHAPGRSGGAGSGEGDGKVPVLARQGGPQVGDGLAADIGAVGGDAADGVADPDIGVAGELKDFELAVRPSRWRPMNAATATACGSSCGCRKCCHVTRPGHTRGSSRLAGPLQDPGIQARSGRTLTPSGRSLA